MSERLVEMQARNIMNLLYVGGGLIVAWPVAWILVPFGIVIGAGLAVVGAATIVRAFRMKAQLRRQLAAAASLYA
jgi:hypothetical protein